MDTDEEYVKLIDLIVDIVIRETNSKECKDEK